MHLNQSIKAFTWPDLYRQTSVGVWETMHQLRVKYLIVINSPNSRPPNQVCLLVTMSQGCTQIDSLCVVHCFLSAGSAGCITGQPEGHEKPAGRWTCGAAAACGQPLSRGMCKHCVPGCIHLPCVACMHVCTCVLRACMCVFECSVLHSCMRVCKCVYCMHACLSAVLCMGCVFMYICV